MRKRVREHFVNSEALFICEQKQNFVFVESRGKVLNVLACLLVEQVGEEGKKEKAKSRVVLESWIPSEPETPLATSRAKRCLSSGEG